MSYNLGPVKPWVRAAADELGPKFGITSIGGYRASAVDQNGHPAGRALDLMVSDKKRGTALAEYARANARRLGVEYVIWRQRIWSVARDAEGWRSMSDRGSPTANHMDHVHVNFNATPPAGGGKVVDHPTPTWKPGTKRVDGKPTPGANGTQGGAQGGQTVPAGFDLPGVSGIRDLAIISAALLGGVALIALGAAATTQRAVKSSGVTDDLQTAATFLPQRRAAAAATTATKTTTPKGTP